MPSGDAVEGRKAPRGAAQHGARRSIVLASAWPEALIAVGTSVMANWLAWRLTSSWHTFVAVVGATVSPLVVLSAIRAMCGVLDRRRTSAKVMRARGLSLREAANEGARATCIGRVRCLDSVSAPHSHEACAAYVARFRGDVDGACQVESRAGSLELETADGVVALERGRWKVADPFGGRIRNAEARIDEGAEVAVRAFVDVSMAPGEDYRAGAAAYRLRAGGKITPIGMVFSARSGQSPSEWLATPLAVSFLVSIFAYTLSVMLSAMTSPPRAPAAVAATPADSDSSSSRSSPASCGDTGECQRPLVCDGESWQCVHSLPKHLEIGEACKVGQCGPGLRCRADLFAGSDFEHLKRQCTASCMKDADCPSGDWCLPCMEHDLEQRGDCVEPSRVDDAIGVVCDLVHKKMRPRAPAPSSSAPVQPPH